MAPRSGRDWRSRLFRLLPALDQLKFENEDVEADFEAVWAATPHAAAAWVLTLLLAVAAVEQSGWNRKWVFLLLSTAVVVLVAVCRWDIQRQSFDNQEGDFLSAWNDENPAAVIRVLKALPALVMVGAAAVACRGLFKTPESPALTTVAALVLLVVHVPASHRQAIQLGGLSGLAATALALAATRQWHLAGLLFAMSGCALHARWESELSARVMYLRWLRLMAKASQFHALLVRMLPPQLVNSYLHTCLERLEGGCAADVDIRSVSIGEKRPQCGVLFMAIDSFDEIMGNHNSHTMVTLLNELFSVLDNECLDIGHGVVKIETVQEVYVAACGVLDSAPSRAPRRRPSRPNVLDNSEPPDALPSFGSQLNQLVELADRANSAARRYCVKLRAGIHCGPVVAGIVGDRLPRFRLFGDTMNTAARLEQHCPPGRVLFSEAARLVLENFRYLEQHGELQMKGLDRMPTFLLEVDSDDEDDDAFMCSTGSEIQQMLRNGGSTPLGHGEESVRPPSSKSMTRTKTSTSPLSPESQLGMSVRRDGFGMSSVKREKSVAEATELVNDEPAVDVDSSTLQKSDWISGYSARRIDSDEDSPETLEVAKIIDDSCQLPPYHLWFSDRSLEDQFRAAHAARSLEKTRMFCVCCGAALLLLVLQAVPTILVRSLAKVRLAVTLFCLAASAPWVPSPIGAWMMVHLTAVVLATACALASQGFGDALEALLPWLWPVVGSLLRMPLFATAPGVIAGLVLSAGQGCSSYLLAPAVLMVLQWHDERVERIGRMVHRVESGAQERMKAVAENLMPPSVVQEMRSMSVQPQGSGSPKTSVSSPQMQCMAHRYDLLTVLQTDLVGFTAFARSKPPEEVVLVINSLFRIFDSCVNERGVYKMETIGDAYVCVSGLPDYGSHSASTMLLLATDFIAAVTLYKERCGLETQFGLRVGVHSGGGIGGVVGTVMQRYHLFGNTIRIAEVLESTAPSGHVHLSQRTYDLHLQELSSGDLTPSAQRLQFLEVDQSNALTTSKGEVVPLERVDNQATFLLDIQPVLATRGSAKSLSGHSLAEMVEQSPKCDLNFDDADDDAASSLLKSASDRSMGVCRRKSGQLQREVSAAVECHAALASQCDGGLRTRPSSFIRSTSERSNGSDSSGPGASSLMPPFLRTKSTTSDGSGTRNVDSPRFRSSASLT